MTANEVSGGIAILAVFALAFGAVWFYLQAQHLRPPDPPTPQDYEDLGERVWVNWSDPQLEMMWKVVRQPWRAGEPPAPLSNTVETEAEKARRWEQASVRIELEED